MDFSDRIKKRTAELLIATSALSGVVPPAIAGQKRMSETEVSIETAALAKSIRENVAKGNYRELEPSMVTDYKSLAKVSVDAGHTGSPRIFHDTENYNREPSVLVVGSLNSRPVILANSAAIKVTPEYAKAYAVVSRQEMQGWVLASKAGMADSVSKAYARLAAKQGFAKAPPVYLNPDDRSTVPSAEAALTHSGESVLVVNRAKLRQSPAEVLGSLAHELEHVVKGDTSPERMAQALNDPAISRSFERDADNGAKHLCRPVYLAQSIQTAVEAKAKRSAQLVPNLSQADAIKRLAEVKENSTHPSFAQRIKAIRQLPENTPGCVSIDTPKR